MYFVRCGSLKYELVFVVDKENAAQLSKELSSRSNQSITYDGKQLSVNQLEVNDVDGKTFYVNQIGIIFISHVH
jgi:thiamine monophosphate kinase